MKLQKFFHGEFLLAVIPTYPGTADYYQQLKYTWCMLLSRLSLLLFA